MVIVVSLSHLFLEIEALEDEMVRTLMALVRIPAIAPESGGEGESKKAEKLVQILKGIGFDRIEHHDAEDERVPSEVRPNLIAYYDGQDEAKKLWIVTHMDVVPPGEESLWTVTNPFEATVSDGKVYGRGSEDNGQSLIASIFAVKALKNLGIRPRRTVALAFVADEEEHSTYGIQHLIKLGLFGKDDLIVVPDYGHEKGDFIEIAEKSTMSFKVRTIGKQTHASTPGKGLNAHRVGMEYTLALDEFLHEKYSAKNEKFDPPESTFEPTKKDKNVDAVNIIPGEDIVYFDCRILPEYNPDEVLNDASVIAEKFEKKHGAKIEIKLRRKTVAPKPTDINSNVVRNLKEAIKKARKIEPKVGGIGGGTCAAFFRKAGIPAVVWSTIDETAHQPDEYAKVDNLINDAKVFALVAIS
jgi:succinyl-diaminopimelate desuccinylase